MVCRYILLSNHWHWIFFSSCSQIVFSVCFAFSKGWIFLMHLIKALFLSKIWPYYNWRIDNAKVGWEESKCIRFTGDVLSKSMKEVRFYIFHTFFSLPISFFSENGFEILDHFLWTLYHQFCPSWAVAPDWVRSYY